MAPPRTLRFFMKKETHRGSSSSPSCIHQANEPRKEADHRISKRYKSKRRHNASSDDKISEEKVLELLERIKSGLQANDVKEIKEALIHMRGGLADSEHIETVIQGDIMPLLDTCLKHEDREINYSAIWILTNVACGDSEQTALVVDRLPRIKSIFDKMDDKMLAQILWLLANLAGDSQKCRDEVMAQVPLSQLESFVNSQSAAPVLENAAWLMSNIARQGPSEEPMCEDILKLLCKILDSELCDCEVVSEVCRTLLHTLHSLVEPDTLDKVKSSGALHGIIRHTTLHCSRSCIAEMVKLVADLLSVDDDSCQVFIDQGALNVLSIVMHEEISSLYYYACFAIANVFACSSAQIQCAINHNLLPAAIYHLEHGDFKIQREAAIALCSFLSSARERQVLQAFNKGIVPPLVKLLRHFDMSIVYDILASLFNLMKFAKELNMEEEFLHELIDAGVRHRVECLVHVGHDQVAQLATNFIEMYLAPRYL